MRLMLVAMARSIESIVFGNKREQICNTVKVV